MVCHIMGCITQLNLKRSEPIFFYSVEINERPLRKELLTDPDLTNNIAGIIRRNGIAFVADVEAMYY